MPTQALLFDYGGTLDSDGTPWLERFRPLYAKRGLDIPKDAFDRAFYDSDDRLAERHSLEGLGLEETVRLQVLDFLAAAAPSRLDLAEIVARDFSMDCRRHFQKIMPVLKRLKVRYKLGIVSNFYGNLGSILAGEEIGSLFDAIADSSVVGALKPEASIFRHALDALDCNPQDACMVGDSLGRDMRGAEALGMGHVWLSPEGGSCCPKGASIRTLADLESVLEVSVP